MLVLPTFPSPFELRTRRTLLRQWKETDLPAWVEMNADAEVRRHFASVHSETQALEEARRCREAIAQRGWGLWALELPGRQAFAGVVGLIVTGFEAPFVPCVEIGWRLRREAWGKGYASEAATAAAGFGFARLELEEIVAITAVGNAPSRRVMERLGMRRDAQGDFDHPGVPAAHPLRRHVLYRLRRDDFLARTAVSA